MRDFLVVFVQCCGDHRDLHSFPTRRSSDLLATPPSPSWATIRPSSSASPSTRPSPMLPAASACSARSEEHTSELQSLAYLVCRPLLDKKNFAQNYISIRSTP